MMRHYIEKEKNVVMGDLKRMFMMINVLLDHAGAIIVEAHMLIDTV